MNHRKQSILVLLGLSVLALAGCSHSGDATGAAPGPNDNDKAAEAALKQNSGQDAAKQAAIARARASGTTAGTAPK